jgi:hypothetical protein
MLAFAHSACRAVISPAISIEPRFAAILAS